MKQGLTQVQGIGAMNIAPSGQYFCSFLSIPYAKPPVGPLRFEPPQPIDLSAYSYIWDFRFRSPVCIQNPVFINITHDQGQENCLYLNVYTKPTYWHSLKPVIIWVHGGLFNYGHAYFVDADRPDLLVDEDVVVVTFNYRLGVLGFLYREGEGIAGNNGLRDQQEVFKWVQRNIVAFGGDPKRVTLMGWSAGSAAIAYHLQAPSSLGLFHGAIMLSGVNFNPWAYQRSNEECVKILCKNLGIPCTRGGLKNTLKQIPADIFGSYDFNYNLTVSYFGEPWACFVPTFDGGDAPLGKAMVQSRHQKLKQQPIISDVPLMIGYTVSEIWYLIRANMNSLGAKWNYSYPYTKPNVIGPLRRFLLSKSKELNNYSKELIGGSAITFGVQKFADYYSGAAISDTYLYRFSHKNTSNDIGAFHTDDLAYIFIPSDPTKQRTYEDALVRYRFVRYITNFAKF
uniref:Carboxylic ester hydrolase n=1 Tax=Phlebotomus papatasi TaxID=29031 RepID=A0A1B0DK70_PHLPP